MSEPANLSMLTDQSWVEVQTNTFTNWVNNAISSRAIKITDMSKDLDDGLILIALFEILTCAKMPRHSKTPRVRAQQANNISTALKFITDDGVRLVNIGAEDILDHNNKLILGLIWSLILRYQIVGIEAGSPKALLLEWVNRKIAPYPVAKVINFKGSWVDGDALTALTDAMQPGICALSEKTGNPVNDIDRAMENAHKDLEPGIPRLLKPEHMADAIDDLSVMTYVSCFKDWEENQSKRRADILKAGRCWMDGPGLEDCHTKAPNVFTIHSVGDDGKPATEGGDNFVVVIDGPETPDIKTTDDLDGTYTVKYAAQTPGTYKVNVSYLGYPIKDSPKTIQIEHAIDASKTYAEGLGLESGKVKDHIPTNFTIYSLGPDGRQLTDGDNDIEVRIRSPNNAPCEVAVNDNNDGTYGVSYCAEQPGDYEIDVLAGGKHIKGSTFRVHVDQSIQHELVTGTFTYTVKSRDCNGDFITTGGADWKVIINGPNTSEIQVKTSDNGDGSYTASYELAAIEGADSEFTVLCRLDGELVGNSPFKHRLGPKPSIGKRLFAAFKGITGRNSARTVTSGVPQNAKSKTAKQDSPPPPSKSLPTLPSETSPNSGISSAPLSKFCTECGASYPSDTDRFCVGCGSAR